MWQIAYQAYSHLKLALSFFVDLNFMPVYLNWQVDLTAYVEKHEFCFDAVLDEYVTNDEVCHCCNFLVISIGRQLNYFSMISDISPTTFISYGSQISNIYYSCRSIV